MAQLEYGHYYKFVVSCGVGLLLVAVGLPWLFLHEPFDLLMEASKLSAMTPLARDVVLHRQQLVASIIRLVPYASAVSGVGGIGLTLYGLIAWRKRQGVRDTTENVILDKTQEELKQMKQMTQEQVIEKVRAEVAIQEPDTFLPSAGDGGRSMANAVEDYLETENTLLDALESRLPQGYTLLRHQTSMSYQYDGVLRSSDTNAPELMIEIKKLGPDGNIRNALDALTRVSHGAALANFDSKIRHIPMLIVISTELRAKQMEEISKFLQESMDNPTAIGRSLVRFITPTRLQTLSAKDIQAVLDPSQRLVVLSDDSE